MRAAQPQHGSYEKTHCTTVERGRFDASCLTPDCREGVSRIKWNLKEVGLVVVSTEEIGTHCNGRLKHDLEIGGVLDVQAAPSFAGGWIAILGS